MIPRVFHFIWVGDGPVPTLMDAWADMHPDWEIRLWDEAALRKFGLRNAEAFEWYLQTRLWHGAANIARVEIVERLGGVYLDMDTVPVRPFDGAPFMDAGLFAGYVQPRPEYPGLIGNAYIGAVPHHPVLRTAIRLVERGNGLTPPWIKTGVVLFTHAVTLHQERGRSDIHIAPVHVFFPHDKVGEIAPEGEGLTYARHLWGSTRKSPWTYGMPT